MTPGYRYGITHYVAADGGGAYIEFFTDDDGGSGYGDGARFQRYYFGRGVSYDSDAGRELYANVINQGPDPSRWVDA